MKILVNAISLRVAGGRAVGLNFLRALGSIEHPHSIHALVPAGAGYEEVESSGVTIHCIPVRRGLSGRRLWYEYVTIPRAAVAVRPDAIFCMGNLAVPVDVPQVVLLQWPYAIYPDAEVWRLMDWRSRIKRQLRLMLFRRRMRYATLFAVQTETARGRFQDLYGFAADSVRVVPNAVSLPPARRGAARRYLGAPKEGERRLLCLARYYPHKNLEVLLPVARMIQDRGDAIRIITTVAPEEHRGAEAFLRTVDEQGLRDVICNIGPVPMDDVPGLYSEVNALLLPSLLESFSGTYIEAMHFGVPVLTSDRDFARDVCGDAAYYFDPLDPADIYGVIMRALRDQDDLNRRVARGKELVARMPGWDDVAKAYLSLLEEAANSRAASAVVASAGSCDKG